MKSETDPVPNPAIETHIVKSEYGSVLSHERVHYAVTQDGNLNVPIPSEIAERIVLAMRLQSKVYDNKDEDASHVMQTLNCRKSVLFVSGAADLEESILSNSSGEEVMRSDIERLLQSDGAIAELTNYADFSETLDNYEGSFPCVVHVFESDIPVDIKSFPGIISILHKVHSFLVLGEDDGGYVCFQKVGPAVNEPFTITDLSFVTHLYRNKKNRTGYFVYGPYK